MSVTRVVLCLAGGVHCGADVLTWAGHCCIASRRCRVCAPGPPPAWISSSLGPLEPPFDEMYHKVPDWPTDGWGMINSTRFVTIDAVGLEVVDSSFTSGEEMLDFDKSAAQWSRRFYDWLTVLAEGPTAFEWLELCTRWLSEDANRQLDYASYRAGYLFEPEPVSLWGWQHAFHHATDGDDAPLARKLRSLAMRDAARGDARNAIIHVATAAECALTNGLRRHLLREHSPEEVQRRMARNRMLGRLLKFARELGFMVPDDAKEALLEPRNAVVHTGQHASNQAAWRAIGTASKIVETFDPLPSHCEEPYIVNRFVLDDE